MHIFIYKIDETKTKIYQYDKFLAKLTDIKRERLLRYKFTRDFLLSLSGEILLSYGLKKLYGINQRPELYYGKYQKPYFKDLPIYFNISHSGAYTVCAVGDTKVGIDIEKKSNGPEELLSLGKRFFSAGEYDDLKYAADQVDFFYSIWTLKESYIKYSGKGLYQDLTSFGFKLDKNSVIFSEAEDLNFFTRNYSDDYRLALCTVDSEYLIEEIDNQIVDDILR